MSSSATLSLFFCLLAPASSLSATTYFQRVVNRAVVAVDQKMFESELPLTRGYIAGTLAFNLAAHIAMTREVAMALHLPIPTLFDTSLMANLQALAWGLPGAIAISTIETARCRGHVFDDFDGGNFDGLDCARSSALTNPVLVGTAPLAILSSLIVNDRTVGGRAVALFSDDVRGDVSRVKAAPLLQASDAEEHIARTDAAWLRLRDLPSSTTLLSLGGALASCAWAQGVLQVGVCYTFHEATMRASMSALEGGGAGLPLPALAVRMPMAVEPAVVVALTASVVAIMETGLASSLQPVANARTRATADALAHAKQRAFSLFALEAPGGDAASAAATFEQRVSAWETYRAQAARTDAVASAARAGIAATVFVASGGCLLAPVVASLGVLGSRVKMAELLPCRSSPSLDPWV